MLEKWFNPTHGLELLPNINTGRRQNENGILFYTEYLLLKKRLYGLDDQDRKQAMQLILNLRAWSKHGTRFDGLFDRGQDESRYSSLHRKISHDNITAISRLAYELKLGFNYSIAKHGIKYNMIFDNMCPDEPRFLYRRYDTDELGSPFQWHPRDWFYWLYLGGYSSSILFFPVFLLANILACYSDKGITSGKLMMFTRCYNSDKKLLKFTWNICNKILKKKYNTDNWMIPVTDIYFGQSKDNPIRVLTNMITNL